MNNEDFYMDMSMSTLLGYNGDGGDAVIPQAVDNCIIMWYDLLMRS